MFHYPLQNVDGCYLALQMAQRIFNVLLLYSTNKIFLKIEKRLV